MPNLKAWSYSRYAAYEQCPLQFKLKFIDKVPEEDRPAFTKGDDAHKALAQYVMGYGDDTPPAIVKAPLHRFYRELRAFPADDKVAEQQWGFTSEWAPTGWFGNDTWFRNIVDAALVYEDMTGEAIDHKTGRVYDSHADQIELNALAMFCHFRPVTQVASRMVYVEHGTEKVVDYHRHQVPHLTAKWNKKVAGMFNDSSFLPRPNDKCRFCSYSRSKQGQCRFG